MMVSPGKSELPLVIKVMSTEPIGMSIGSWKFGSEAEKRGQTLKIQILESTVERK